MIGDWTRDDVLVWFTADEWDEITSALRNRAPTNPSSSVNTVSDPPVKDAPMAPLSEGAGGPAPMLLEDGPGGTRTAEQGKRVPPGATSECDMRDLRERCQKAVQTLAAMIRDEKDRTRIDHLQSKRAGVLLVLDYMRVYEGWQR